jgi:hypothetical protein
MSTTTSTLNKLRNALRNAVTNIGNTNGTKRPPTDTNDNRQGIAYELAVAQLVVKRAEARYKEAIKQAIAADVMFDHKADPLPANSVKELYRDDIVSVTVRTTSSHSRLNTSKLRDILVKKYEMTFDEVNALLIDATDKSKPPHEFIADIITTDESRSLSSVGG